MAGARFPSRPSLRRESLPAGFAGKDSRIVGCEKGFSYEFSGLGFPKGGMPKRSAGMLNASMAAPVRLRRTELDHATQAAKHVRNLAAAFHSPVHAHDDGYRRCSMKIAPRRTDCGATWELKVYLHSLWGSRSAM